MVAFILHLIGVLLIASILYWLAGLCAALAPAPLQSRVRAVLLILLGLLLIAWIAGEFGVYDNTWGALRGGRALRLP